MADYDLLTLNTVTPQAEVSQGSNRAVANDELVLEKDLVITEVADHSSTPVAGYGYLWIRSDTPNVLIFTDDAGTDWVLNIASGGTGWNVSDDTYSVYGHGVRALDSITVGSGKWNIAIGEDAATALTTGDRVIAIGRDALKTISTNGAAIAIGDSSCYQATSAGIAVYGANTCLNLTSGADVTVYGSSSGGLLSTGSYGIAIGANVNFTSSTEDYQVLIGGFGHKFISGHYGPRTDVDTSGRNLKFSGPQAYQTASTNLDGGDLIVEGGAATATGAGVGGDLYLRGGTKGSTGATGLIMMDTIPTADPSVAGALWNNSGVLTVSAG